MLILNVLAASLHLAAVAAVPQLSAGESNQTFNSWAARHGKVYETASERLRRLEIWLENAHDIRAHQNEGHSWTMELNEFADLRCGTLYSLPNQFHIRTEHIVARSEEEFAARNGLLPTRALPIANNGTQVTPLSASLSASLFLCLSSSMAVSGCLSVCLSASLCLSASVCVCVCVCVCNNKA